jgi:hypothetical protein
MVPMTPVTSTIKPTVIDFPDEALPAAEALPVEEALPVDVGLPVDVAVPVE